MKTLFRVLFLCLLPCAALAQGPNAVRTFPSITGTGGIVGLGAASGQYINSTVTVQGYATPNDGGGGSFQWNATSTATADAGTIFAATGVSTGRWLRQGISGQEYNMAWFGAKCGGVQVVDGVSTSTTTVTSASAKWGNVKSGWVAVINGGNSSGNQLVTTVTTVNSSSSLTLATATLTSGTGLTIYVYPDDTTAISNTVSAANAANVAIALPAGQTCGLSNPGIFNVLTLTGPGMDLNNGQLWVGQTGPVNATGWVFAINSNNSGVWNGTINGLYQTNQNVSQGQSGTIVFNSGSIFPGYSGNFLSNVTIQNTKARGFIFTNASNTWVSNVTMKGCGDLTYSAGYAGMAFCGQIENPQGSLQVSNYTANGCSQSCLIVDNLSGGTFDSTLSVNINNFNASAAGYYALDLETLLGCTRVSNVGIDNSTITPSGNIIGGGIIARDIRCHQQDQVVINSPGNSDIVEDSSNDTPFGNQYVQLSNLKLINAAHSGLLEVVTNAGFATTRFSIDHVITDVFQLTTASGYACSTTNPMLQLVSFDDVHVSHLYGGTYDTVYSQQGNASTMYYIQGKDSDLGRVDYTSVGTNPLATDLDYFRVFEQTVTYSGGIARIGRATTTWNNPFSTFVCPT